jgi:PAS domain S-box-containing protein
MGEPRRSDQAPTASEVLHKLPAALVLCVGITLSVLVARFIDKDEAEREHATFLVAASDTIDALERRIEGELDIVRSIASFFASTPEVSEESFHAFLIDPLSRFTGIQALQWVPQVPDDRREAFERAARATGHADFFISDTVGNPPKRRAADSRPEYFPLRYIEPRATNEGAFGIDQGYEPKRRAAMQLARLSNQITMTGKIELLRLQTQRTSVLAFAPVFPSTYRSMTPEDRYRSLRGFAVGVLRLSEVLESVMLARITSSAAGLVPIKVYIYDESESSANNILYAYESARGEVTEAPILKEAMAAGGYSETNTFGGRLWTFVALPQAGFITGLTGRAISAFIASLLLTLALAGYLHASVNRTRAIERQVTNRTAELKQVNEALAASEQRIRTVTNSVPALIAYLDKDLIYRFANERYRSIGVDPNNLIGRPISETRRDELWNTVQPYYERAARGEAVQFEYMRHGPDGPRFWAATLSPDFDADGSPRGFYSLARDLTDIKRAELELDQFFSHTLNLMCVISADGALRRTNPNWNVVLGYTTAELGNRPFADFVHPADQAKLASAMTGLRNGTDAVDLELRLIRKDGREIWTLWNAAADLIEGTIYATGHDVSGLKEVDRMKDEFVSTVSHELRTPLTSIKGALGLIRAKVVGTLAPELNAMLEIAYKNCDRLVLLINDILDIEKMEAGKMDFRMLPLDLGQIARAAVAANQTYAEQFGVRLVLKEPSEPMTANVDEARMMQVLANLLSNASKFSPRDSIVEISVTRTGPRYRVAVQDHGTGIPESFRAKIFDKFSQNDSSDTRKVSGTGLGLNIVRAIIQLHGGAIDFVSEIGKGTTFFFDIPALGAAPEIPVPAPVKSSGKPRLLICEDDADVARVLTEILAQNGYDVEVAPTAADALRRLGEQDYAAMTLDILLPDLNGLELLSRVRGQAKTAAIPVVVVSATADPAAERPTGNAVGIVDWLTKPYDERRLLAAIRTAIKTAPELPARILHVEDDRDLVQVIRRLIGGEAQVVSADSIAEAERRLREQRFDLIILDLMLPDGRGESLLPHARDAHGRPVPVIVFSALEVPKDVAQRVQAALVKSRVTDDALIDTIRSLIARRDTSADEVTSNSARVAS